MCSFILFETILHERIYMKSKDVYELLRKVYKGDSLDTKSKTFDYLCDNGLILSIPSDKYKRYPKIFLLMSKR